MAARDGADRRRERRLRSWLRHEQQSIAAVLATVTHHSFDKVGTASGVLRNRKTATRTGNGEEHKAHYTAMIRKTPLPGGSGMRLVMVFSHFSPQKKSATVPPHSGRNCLRTRAHGRRLLMTSMGLEEEDDDEPAIEYVV